MATPEPASLEVRSPKGIAVLSASFTRPANTTQYTANDLVGPVAAVDPTNSPEIANAVAIEGDGFRIERVRLRKSNKSITSATFRVHIFNRLPTWDVGDNGAGGAISALAVTDLVGHVGYIDVTMDRASATAGAYGVAVPAVGSSITVKPNSGTSFYVAVQATGTYTPVSGETFEVQLEGIRP